MPSPETKIVCRRRSSFSCAKTFAQLSQRKASRQFVRLPARIRVDSSPHDEHVAFVRDLSPLGIFFYSDFKPTSGERISFDLQYRKGAKPVNMHFKGWVVRVEQAMPTSATGIAVAFDCEQQERARTPIRRPWFDIVAKVHSPTLRAINTGKTREVLIQERGAQTPRFNQQCPAHKVPKLGAIFSVESRNFVVMEEKQVLLKRDNDAIRGVLLIVEDFDALSW